MTDIEDILLNDNDFFGDTVDTPKKGTEQHIKCECLKGLVDRGKLGHKWAHERVDKTYTEYKQREITQKGEETAKGLGKHVINLYSTGVSRWLKIKDVKKLQQDIGNDLFSKDQMVNVGCHLVYTLGDYLAPVLVGVHTINNLDHGDEQENEGYESEEP